MKSVDLFKIIIESETWNFTSSDKDHIYDGEVYYSVTMSRTEIEQKNEISKASLKIDIPIDHDLAVKILTSYIEQIITVTVFTDDDGDVSVSWRGRFSNFQPSEESLSLNFESIFTSMRRPGLRAIFQKSCRHALYGKGCDLNPDDFVVSGTLNAVSGNILTVPEAALQPNGYFTGGMVSAPDGILSYVIDHSGSQVTLQRISTSLKSAFSVSGPGLSISLFPGCDHSRSICNSKFDNLLNYGGFDWIPDKNPMDGSSIV